MLTADLNKERLYLLTLSGDFDLHEKEKVLSFLPQVLSNRCKGLVIDISGVSLLTSAAVHVFSIYLSEFKKRDKTVVIVSGSDNYSVELFKDLGIFDNLGIKIFESIGEAKVAIVQSGKKDKSHVGRLPKTSPKPHDTHSNVNHV